MTINAVSSYGSKRVGSLLGKGYYYLMQSCGLAAGAIIAMVSVVIVVNIVIRNLNIGYIPGTTEGSEYAIASATFLAAPWVLFHSAHVRVDLLPNLLPEKYNLVLEAVVNLLGIMICSIFFYYLWDTGFDYFQRQTMVYKTFTIPEWWTFALPVFCFLMLSVEFICRLGRTFLFRGE